MLCPLKDQTKHKEDGSHIEINGTYYAVVGILSNMGEFENNVRKELTDKINSGSTSWVVSEEQGTIHGRGSIGNTGIS
jgi:hypothetical protein